MIISPLHSKYQEGNMPDLATLKPGDVVSFKSKSPTVLRDDFDNVVVVGVVNYDMVKYTDVDALATHVRVYPTLPTPKPIPDDFTSYPYLLFKYPNGNLSAIGIPFINSETLVSNTTKILDVVIFNRDVSDIELITRALSSNGIKDFTITPRA